MPTPNQARLLASLIIVATPSGLQGQAGIPRAGAQPVAAFPEQFSQVRGTRELSSGVVLVTDWTEERLMALDFAAGTATAIGRVGRGPREYRLPSQLLPWPGDSTLLVDGGNERFAVIGPDLAIHRTMPARRGTEVYTISPRGADRAGHLYFGVPPWALGPDAPPGDSVDLVRWDPGTDRAEPPVARVQGSRPPSWVREGRPRMTPGIPMVMFSAQDAWAVAPDGRLAVVRSGDYHVEWRGPGGQVTRGPSYTYPQLPVTEADKRAFVKRFLQSSPMSGKGPEGGLGHTPAEHQTDEEVARMVRTNEFADRHPYFRPGGPWITSEGELWVERSVAEGATPVFDVFDSQGRLTRQVSLPAGRRVVGTGRGVIYAVVKNADDLETLERYRSR